MFLLFLCFALFCILTSDQRKCVGLLVEEKTGWIIMRERIQIYQSLLKRSYASATRTYAWELGSVNAYAKYLVTVEI